MKMRLVSVLFVVLLVVFLGAGYSPVQQVSAKNQEQKMQTEEPEEKVVVSPQDIKEETGVYVFLGWLWLSIFVLIYFLRLKIKEVDRLHHLKFFNHTE
ncbi:MAG: hypothetical protein ACLFVG_06485 [Candidatus Aminicenantes bacterium]